MTEPGGDLHFGEESLGAKHRAEFRLEHLDGDLSIVLEVLGEIDRGHPARAELALDAVAVGQRSGDARDGLAQFVAGSSR
jgi:hypothetical protein